MTNNHPIRFQSIYSTEIELSEESLDKIGTITDVFGSNDLLNAFKLRLLDKQKVKRWDKYITENYVILNEEYYSLLLVFDVFNKRFATNYNNHFTALDVVMENLTTRFKPLMNILELFCPKSRNDKKRRLHGVTPYDNSVLKNNILSAGHTQLNLFDIQDYPPYVALLYRDIRNFFSLINDITTLGKQTIETEKVIMANSDLCHAIFLNQKEDTTKFISSNESELRNMSKALPQMIKESALYQEFLGEPDKKKFAQERLHRCTEGEFIKFCYIILLVAEQRLGNMSKIETELFGDDLERMRKARYVLANFDSILPQKFKRKNLTMLISFYCMWAGAGQFGKTYRYFCENYAGQRIYELKNSRIPALDSVECYKKKLLRGDADLKLAYENFLLDVDDRRSGHPDKTIRKY